MDQHTTEVIDALNALELGLRELGLWSDARPQLCHHAFCYDTLELEQWLQFIFLGRMREILEQGDRLPESCAIIPYVEMLSGAGKQVHPTLVSLIQRVDWSISGESGSGERI